MEKSNVSTKTLLIHILIKTSGRGAMSLFLAEECFFLHVTHKCYTTTCGKQALVPGSKEFSSISNEDKIPKKKKFNIILSII